MPCCTRFVSQWSLQETIVKLIIIIAVVMLLMMMMIVVLVIGVFGVILTPVMR